MMVPRAPHRKCENKRPVDGPDDSGMEEVSLMLVNGSCVMQSVYVWARVMNKRHKEAIGC